MFWKDDWDIWVRGFGFWARTSRISVYKGTFLGPLALFEIELSISAQLLGITDSVLIFVVRR
jgi:hypothetical protein